MNPGELRQQYVYPAVFTPLYAADGRWRVRFPDLAKEEQLRGDTIEEATITAGALLKQCLIALQRSRRGVPSPTPFEDVAVEEGETVQLIVVSGERPKNTGKDAEHFTDGIVLSTFFCIFSVILLSVLAFAPRGCASAAAESAVLISDLHATKASVLMYKAEHESEFFRLSEGENHAALCAPYVDNPDKYTQKNTLYAFRVIDGVAWVGYDLGKKPAELREKLAGKAAKIGLFGSPAIDVPPVSDDAAHRYDAEAKAVWIRAF